MVSTATNDMIRPDRDYEERKEGDFSVIGDTHAASKMLGKTYNEDMNEYPPTH